MVKGGDGADELMQSLRGLLLAVLDEVNAAVQTATHEDVCPLAQAQHLDFRHRLVGGKLAEEKRRCGSDKSAHDLGRDKLKNASILRKYGSIVWGIDKLFILVSAQK